jgi:peptidoglycan/LPS O-acetylase OafA/YrhL
VPALGTHVPALDGVRGLAILLVMLCHFTLYGGIEPKGLLDLAFTRIATSGWIGVDLFFVLSGFLITGILYDTKASAHYFKSFYARRVLRIFPLYYAFLFGFFVLLPAIYSQSRTLQMLAHEQAWYWAYLSNFLVAIEGWPKAPGTIGHYWSLAVEEQFYLAWPLVVFSFDRRQLIRICVGLIFASLFVRIVLLSHGEMIAAYVLTPARADTLAVGAWIALVGRGPDGLRSLTRWARPVAVGTLVVIATLFALRRGFNSEDWRVQVFGYTPIAVFFGAVLVRALGASPSSFTSRFLSHPVLRMFGHYSYALYVFHLPLTTLIARKVVNVNELQELLGSQLLGQAVFFVVAGSASTAVAFASWRLFESRFLRLKRYFPYENPRHGPH